MIILDILTGEELPEEPWPPAPAAAVEIVIVPIGNLHDLVAYVCPQHHDREGHA